MRFPPVVVVVEDDPQIRTLLTSMIRLWGGQPVSARTARTAHRAVRTRQPRVIVLDLGVPGAPAIVQQLKGAPATRQIPILALATRGELTCIDAAQLGCEACLPVLTVNDLLAKLDALS